MAEIERFESPLAQRLQVVATGYPEVTESPSCVNRAFKARKKNFLFLGEKDDGKLRLMVKLESSLPSAQALAKKQPERWSVGNTGWVTGQFTEETAPDETVLAGWIDESFRLLAPKTVVKQLDS